MLGVWGQINYGSGGRYVMGLGADMLRSLIWSWEYWYVPMQRWWYRYETKPLTANGWGFR